MGASTSKKTISSTPNPSCPSIDTTAITNEANHAVKNIVDVPDIPDSAKKEITKNLNIAIKKISHQQQNKITIGALKEKWYKSEQELANLPDTVATNEKNYYIASDPSGNEKYNSILQKKYTDVINKVQKEEQEKMSSSYKNLELQISTYHSNIISLDRLKQLYKDVEVKKQALLLDIDKYYKLTSTSERKIHYEIQDITRTKYYNTLIRIAYFTVLGCYILFGGFFKAGQYKNIKSLFLLALYITLPFVVNHLVNYTFNLYSNNDGK